jgi:hypothetical protein
MSRAMNLSLAQAEVIAICKKEGVVISAIETLPSGGTHLVTVTGDQAETMRRVLSKHLIEGRVKRFNYMNAPQSQRNDPPTSPSSSPWRKSPLR